MDDKVNKYTNIEGKEISKIKELKKFVKWLIKNNYEYEIPKTNDNFKGIIVFIELYRLDKFKKNKLYRYIEKYVNYINKDYAASFTALRIDI